MGNALRFLYGRCCEPRAAGDSETPELHGVSPSVSALAHDLFHFDITSQVPEGLGKHVSSSKKAQANWYRKLLEAWRESRPTPTTPEDAARLVVQTLKRLRKANVEAILAFYELPIPDTIVIDSSVETTPFSLPDGIKYELNTLPVDAKAIADGDGMTVYVSASDPRESSCVPPDVVEAALERNEARSHRNYAKADALQKIINNSGYRVLKIQDEEILARKYRIRLRGIDAPENEQPYGAEAKQQLTRLISGKCLRILIYGEDKYGRLVGDVYCNNGLFVQKSMLKKGLAWHYAAFDQRPELAKWEKTAKSKRVGLWASPNPEKPWEWRKKNPRED